MPALLLRGQPAPTQSVCTTRWRIASAPSHSTPGLTDLGPSVAYIIASLVMLFAAAGATWSVDGWLRPRMGRFAWLCSPSPDELGR